MSYCSSLSLVLFVLANSPISAQGVEFLKYISGSVASKGPNNQQLTIIFEIQEGYHIQSDDPKSDTVIPTRISFDVPPEIEPGAPGFPEAELMYLEGSEEPLQVFSGRIEIIVPISYKSPLPQDYQIPGRIYYQACDDKRCFYPRELEFEVVPDF
ncbi:MAG: hypothetical protein DHS20C17_20170 [Cyclobacteriaceae bacterium]|nr:MAG: hypothetical protein DHS20C17_20170 [Cyclobacteriaceae bacterium]